jgi:hypothetical protein
MGLDKAAGDVVDVEQTAATEAVCQDGKAGMFDCSGLDLMRWMKLTDFSTQPTSANDIWGFKDLNTGRSTRSSACVTAPPSSTSRFHTIRARSALSGPELDLARHGRAPVLRRSGRTMEAYAYCVSDAVVQGLQIIDLTGLPHSISLANTDMMFSSAHTIHMSNVNRATGVALPGLKPYLYIEGSNLNGGAFRTLDVSNPSHRSR